MTYHDWQVGHRLIAGVSIAGASKAGTLAYGADDPATTMLATFVAQGAGDRVLHLGGGVGIVPAVALVAGQARGVWNADRSWVGTEAARRTLEANREAAPWGQFHVAHALGTHAFGALTELDTVTIRLPTDTASRQHLLWDAFHALREGGRCAIAGATDEGIKPAARELEALFGHAMVVENHSRCRLVVATKQANTPAAGAGAPSTYLNPDTFHRLDVTVRGDAYALWTRPGVFSWEHLDEATALLAEHLEIPAGASVLDLGCGAGMLGMVAARQSGTGRVVLVDADAEAVRCAAKAIGHAGLTNAEVRASDVASAVHGDRFDVVVSNPPFHVGKATALSLPRAFIADAWAVLRPGGRLLLVANRTLPYEGVIAEQFGVVETLHDGRRFKVLAATRGAG